MKSFIFWIIGVIAGALIGYGIAIIFGFNFIFSLGGGLILGSTTAVTLNILRDKDRNQDKDSDKIIGTDLNTSENR